MVSDDLFISVQTSLVVALLYIALRHPEMGVRHEYRIRVLGHEGPKRDQCVFMLVLLELLISLLVCAFRRAGRLCPNFPRRRIGLRIGRSSFCRRIAYGPWIRQLLSQFAQ